MITRRLLVLSAFLSFTLRAATYYVDASRVDDSGTGTSWETAKKTIQAAVNQAAAGDTVLVTNGVYNTGVTVTPTGSLNNRVLIDKEITVKSVNGAAYTFIEGSGTDVFNTASAVRCVFMTNRSKLQGFTLRYGTTLGYATGSSFINICGGGLYASTYYPEIRDCIMRDCSAALGGGADGGTLYSCRLTRNRVTNGGGGCFGSNLYSCLIYDNEGGFAAGSYYGTRVNCTIVGNRTSWSSAGSGVSYGNTYNSIVWNNTCNGVVNNYYLATTGGVIYNSCTTPLPPGVGNITSDPRFINEAANDYRLLAASLCFNMGNNSYVLGATDFAGYTRIQDGTVDMGAYEGPVVATVTFDPQGGGVTPGSKVVIFGALYGNLPTPVRAGYTFLGWQTSANGTRFEVTSSSSVSISTNHTLSASWSGNTYTVTFDPQGGQVALESKAVIMGSLYGDLPVPARMGYTFAGWRATTNGVSFGVASNAVVAIASNHTLSAFWLSNGEVNVTFDAQGGWVTPDYKVVTIGALYGDLPAPVRTGYTFTGWWTSTNGAAFNVTSGSVVAMATNHTLAASWSVNTYSVTLDPQGGLVADVCKPDDFLVAYDAPYGPLPLPVRIGYTFTGWRAITNGIVFGVTSNTVVTIASNHTLKAFWAANTYTVTFDPQNGTAVLTNKEVTFNQPYGALPQPSLYKPVRVDYTFGGWFTGANGAGLPITPGTLVTTVSNHTLFAKWTAESYLCEPREDDPLTTPGQYTGYFYSEAIFADTELPSIRGKLVVTMSKTGAQLTAKAVTPNGVLNFFTRSWDSIDANGMRQTTITASKGETLLLCLRQNRIWGSLSGGSLGNERLVLEGSRNRFATLQDANAQASLEAYKGYYTVALMPYDAVSTGAAQVVPEGSGYLTLTVGASGKVTFAGRLPDGTSFSQTSTLILFDDCGMDACVPLFVPLYGRKGSVGALLWFGPGGKSTIVTDRDLGWFVRWEKPAEKVDGAIVLLDAAGGYYGTTAALAEHYLFSAATNAVPYSYNGGTANLITDALPEDIAVSFSDARLVMVGGNTPVVLSGAYDYSAENSAKATIGFTFRNGIFSGSFNLYYDYMFNGLLRHRTRRVNYYGVLTPVRASLFADEPAGQGFYLVPDDDPLWVGTLLKRSYRITLEEDAPSQ